MMTVIMLDVVENAEFVFVLPVCAL